MFDFGLHSSLLLIGFLQGIVFAALLFRRGILENRMSDHLLAIILTCCSLYIAQYMLGFGGWYDSHDWRSTFMFYFPFHLLIFVGPGIYFYFRSLTNQSFKFKSSDFWHLIPGLIILSIYLVIFFRDIVVFHWINGFELPEHFNTQGTWSSWRQDNIASVQIGIISTFIYALLTIRVYYQYQNYLDDFFSESEHFRFGWLRNLLLIIVLGLAVSWFIEIISYFLPFNYKKYWTSYFALAIMTYILAIQGYIAPIRLPKSLQFEVSKTKEPASIEASLPDLVKWKEKLMALMHNEKLYLNPQLTLQELSQQLNTNSANLSKIINTGFECNFNDFINQLRVKEVEQQIQNGASAHLTFVSIAMECGFNSKATFNRAFKKFTGYSPRDYLAQKEINPISMNSKVI